METIRRRSVAVLLALIAVASSCSKKGPPGPGAGAPAGPRLKTLPAAEARPRLMGSVTIPALDGSLERAAAIATSAMGFPLDAQGLRSGLLAAANLPPGIASHLDLLQPVGVASVSMGKGMPSATALALAARSADAARQAIAALGQPVERREDAIAVQVDGRKLWLLQRDAVLLAAESAEGLVAAAESAMEARRGGTEDLTARIFPDAIAADQGSDVATATRNLLDSVRDTARQQAAGGAAGKVGPEGEALITGALEVFLARVAQTASAEVGLTVDATRGATLTTRLRARPGTDLTRSAQERAAYVMDPALLSAPDLAGAGAAAPSRFILQLMESMKKALLEVPAGAQAGKALESLMASITGGFSTSFSFGRAGIVYEYVYGLKDAASGATALAALESFVTSPLWKRLMQEAYRPGGKQSLTVKREKLGALPGLRIQMSYDLKGMPAAQVKTFKTIMGGNKMEILTAASGTRLLMVTGGDARARLAALAGEAAPAAKPSADLAAAMTETRGHDGFGYIDLGAVVRPALSFLGDPRVEAVATANATTAVPLFFSYRGDGQGEVLSGDLRIPISTFANAGKISQRMMGGAAPAK